MSRSNPILFCLQQNVRVAQTPAMRKFATGQLEAYERQQQRTNQPQKQPLARPNWDRVIPNEKQP